MATLYSHLLSGRWLHCGATFFYLYASKTKGRHIRLQLLISQDTGTEFVNSSPKTTTSHLSMPEKPSAYESEIPHLHKAAPYANVFRPAELLPDNRR